MNKKRLGLLVIFAAAFTCGMLAQSATSLKINEVLISNSSNYQDDYGIHNAWIEIFNTSYASVDLKGCYLTNDKNNPKKYPIPKGDELTKIGPRQHALFWADDKPERGTFHINFNLDPAKDNYIALYDANGETLIDEVTIPANTLGIDQSYARAADGGNVWEVRGINGKHVTPKANNVTLDKNEKVEKFKEHDGSGIGMSLTAMSVVFVALILLYFCFKLVGCLSKRLMRKKEMDTKDVTSQAAAQATKPMTGEGEVYAAIAMALHEMQNDVHDVEKTVMTITKTRQSYSPWSSKILTLRQIPNRNH